MIRLDIRKTDGTFVKTVEGTTVEEALAEYYDFRLVGPVENCGWIDLAENSTHDLDFGPEEE